MSEVKHSSRRRWSYHGRIWSYLLICGHDVAEVTSRYKVCRMPDCSILIFCDNSSLLAQLATRSLSYLCFSSCRPLVSRGRRGGGTFVACYCQLHRAVVNHWNCNTDCAYEPLHHFKSVKK